MAVCAQILGAAFICAIASNASAETELRATPDWNRIVSKVAAWTHPENSGSFVRESPKTTPSCPSSWLGSTPRFALIAQDWQQSQYISGESLSLFDGLRITRSHRMMVSRFRFTGGRISPYAHIGFGQWRVDQDVLPVLPKDVELAAQFGFGVDFQINRRTWVAFERDDTVLIRDQREPQNVATFHMGAYMAALRLDF